LAQIGKPLIDIDHTEIFDAASAAAAAVHASLATAAAAAADKSVLVRFTRRLSFTRTFSVRVAGIWPLHCNMSRWGYSRYHVTVVDSRDRGLQAN
jgi:hypothetical protein